MPINDNGYKIPEEIDSKIPDYFYSALSGELFAVFGPTIFEDIDLMHDEDELDFETYPDDYPRYYNLDMATETVGWHQAFKSVCKRLDIMWLFEYWQKLEYYDANVFNDIMESRIVEKILERQESDWAYCKYLMGL